MFVFAFQFIAYGADGDIDTTYGSNGNVIDLTFSDYDYANDIAIQSDGRIVVAGYSNDSGDNSFMLIRYESNGTRDNSFGSSGLTTVGYTGTDESATSVAIQSDGKIVVAGYRDDGTDKDFLLIRHNENGTLDNSFNTNGVAIIGFTNTDEFASDVAIQEDGKIVVAGTRNNSGDHDVMVARYESNGSLDTSFSNDGYTLSGFTSTNEYATGVAIQSDGKIVVAGYSNHNGDDDAFIIRYNSDGSIDDSYSVYGYTLVGFTGIDDHVNSIAIQSDGKIVVAGDTENGDNIDFMAMRYNTDGTLDTSFNSNGVVASGYTNSDDYAKDVAIQSDGKIVLAGYRDNGSNIDVMVSRYINTGAIDNSFNGDGAVTSERSFENDGATSMAIQDDGNIVIAGYSDFYSNNKFFTMRYLSTAPVNVNINFIPVLNYLLQ